MSVSMTKAEGVTILTLKSNPKSPCPPLFQILGSLCYSPVCCSVSVGLRGLQGSTLTALGTMQIMVGLLNIGLGSIAVGPPNYCYSCLYPYLLGSLFIAFGVMCILAEKFPSPCLVGMNVSVNLVGIALAIVAVVIYAANIGNRTYGWLCQKQSNYGYDYDRYYRRDRYYQTTTTPSPMEENYWEECRKGRQVLSMLYGGLHVLLITLAVLQLCVNISAVVLGIKVLKKNQKGGMENIHDSEVYKSQLDEDATNTTA